MDDDKNWLPPTWRKTLDYIENPKAQTFSDTSEFVSIPSKDLLGLVQTYVHKMEIELSTKWCKCEWILHPDDIDIEEDQCRDCRHAKHNHNREDELDDSITACVSCDCYRFKGRRMRKGAQHAECPVHTREGFLLGFFEWVFSDDNESR